MGIDESKSPWPLAGALSGLCGLVLIGGLAFLLVAFRPEPVTAPTAFKKFNAADQSFGCEYPDGWAKAAGESHAISSAARFRKGGAVILIESDLTGSLVGDMPQPGAGIPDPSEGAGAPAAGIPDLSGIPGASAVGLGGMKLDRRPAVEKLHEARKKTFEAELKTEGIGEYSEQPAQAFRGQLGDARWSEYSADGGFFTGKIHGIRATIMGTERAIYVQCQSPEKDWKVVAPAFKRVLGSIGPAGR
jgi:hypothetical protein